MATKETGAGTRRHAPARASAEKAAAATIQYPNAAQRTASRSTWTGARRPTQAASAA
ncbi:hypothetical protein WMF31_17420 [Sorangium sp. So ce1036]|uniref:hypothetical protein n=1 Tax=Sorangium sp. So ce1036 TaxID=3133328 RepID=UPI003F120F2B